MSKNNNLNPNSESATEKLHHCPQCGESLSVPEYNDQECWTCGWPILNNEEDEDDDNTSDNAPKAPVNGPKVLEICE